MSNSNRAYILAILYLKILPLFEAVEREYSEGYVLRAMLYINFSILVRRLKNPWLILSFASGASGALGGAVF